MTAANGATAHGAKRFGERLVRAVEQRQSQIVLGIDPDPARLWPAAVERTSEARARLAWILADAEGAAGDVRESAAVPDRSGDAGESAADPDRSGDPGAASPSDARAGARAASPGDARAVSPGDARAASPGDARAGANVPRSRGADFGLTARLESAAAVLAHCLAVIDAAGPACVAVKPQLACFERLGAPGWLALEHVCAHARQSGLIVLADGKRGDVPVTAAAYAQALVGETPSPFGPVPGLQADAFTANPLLGRDALEPLLASARAHGAGAFVLVRTSNPGAADVLDAQLVTGERLWEHLARMVAELGEGGAADGLSDVGAVTGATEPEHLARLRELMPRTPFLLPGIGAQGGDVASLAPAFQPGRAGGLVSASRAIVNAYEQRQGADPAEAARAEAERLREQAWALG